MLRHSNIKVPINEVGQVPGCVVGQPLVSNEVVPWCEFRGFKNALAQLGGNTVAIFKIAPEWKHA